MSKKILVTCDLSTEGLAILKSQTRADVVFSQNLQPNQEELKDTHVLLVRSGTKVNMQFLEQAPLLEFVVTATSGFDHLDLKSLKARNISASFCPTANAESAAQLTIAMILNSLRNLPMMHQTVQKNHWRGHLKRGLELTDLQLGVVGLGRIGLRVAQLAKAFKMKLTSYDPYVDRSVFDNNNIEPLGLIELFKTSDVITFHVPLTTETKHFINHQTIPHINPEAFIINASRGAVIDDSELAVRMREGLFRGVALDVFEKEPLPKESPLHDLENAIFSPHIGAFTEQAFARGSQEAAEKVCAFLNQNTVTDPLPPATPWAEFLI